MKEFNLVLKENKEKIVKKNLRFGIRENMSRTNYKIDKNHPLQ